MNDDDALPFEMRQHPGHHALPTLDDETADRLLTGRLDPADAPPGYAAVAELVAAATAPASTEELAAAPEAAARFAAATRPGFPAPRRPHRVKVAATVLVALLSVGGVAAAAGIFPAPAKPAADRGPRGGGGKAATTARQDAATTTTAAAVNQARGGGAVTGPDTTGPATGGLCRAWRAARGKDKHKQDGERDDKKDRKHAGKREDSTAFRALAAAAGGADRIAAYCQATTATDPPGGGNRDGGDDGGGDDEGGASEGD
jgi:hypothetical protein